MLRPGRFACPAPVRTFTLELSLPLSPSEAPSITTRVYSQFPGLDLHQLDTQHYGLRAKQSQSQSEETFQRKGVSRLPSRWVCLCKIALRGDVRLSKIAWTEPLAWMSRRPMELLRKAANSKSGKHSKGRDPAPPFPMGRIALRGDIRLSKIVWTEPLAWMSRCLSSCCETQRIPISDSCNKRRRARHRQVPECDPGHKGRTSIF